MRLVPMLGAFPDLQYALLVSHGKWLFLVIVVWVWNRCPPLVATPCRRRPCHTIRYSDTPSPVSSHLFTPSTVASPLFTP